MENFRLKVFRTVAKHLNFRKAAEELCLTQPAVTLQIKTLEQYLGVQLFDRSGARISLTSAGSVLLKYARNIEELESAALAALALLAGDQRGDLRIGASLTIAQYILPHLLGAFQQQHPQVRPHVTTCNTVQVLEALVARDVSVGFSERGFVEPAELKQERMIMRERGSGTRRVVEMALQKAGVQAKQLKLAMEFDSTEGIMTAVEAGLGIGFASLWSISKALQLGSLRVVPIHDVRITRPLRVAYARSQEPQGITLAFLHFLRSRHAVLSPIRSKIRPPSAHRT